MTNEIIDFIVKIAACIGFITIIFAIGGMLHLWDFTYTVKAHKDDKKPRLTVDIQ